MEQTTLREITINDIENLKKKLDFKYDVVKIINEMEHANAKLLDLVIRSEIKKFPNLQGYWEIWERISITLREALNFADFRGVV